MLNLLVQGFPVVNVLFICMFLYAVTLKEKGTFILFFLLYGMFHYAYVVPAMFLENMQLLVRFHQQSKAEALIALAFFLFVWAATVMWVFRKKFLDWGSAQRYFMLAIVSLSFFLVLPYISMPSSMQDLISVKSDVSVLLMLVCSYMLFTVIKNEGRQISQCFLNVLIWASVVVFGIAIYEVFNGFSWAMGLMSDGALFARPSSTLMNPNVFGLWSVFLLVFALYLKDEKYKFKIYSVFFAIGLLGLFLSGSRSSFLLCLGLLFVVGLLKNYMESRLLSNFRYLVLVVVLFYILCFIGYFYGGTLKPLSFRFFDLPITSLDIMMNIIVGYKGESGVDNSFLASLYGRLGISEAPTVVSAYSDYVYSAYYDNAYLALKANSILTVGVWSLAMFFLAFLGIKKFLKNPSVFGVYALTSLFGFVFIGFIIRAYQVYPVWSWCALLLAIYMIWLAKRDDKVLKQGGGQC